MFSEVQRNYVEQLVKSDLSRYPYYVAFTNSNISGSGGYDDYSFYVLVSPSKITASNRYTFSVPANSILYGVRSGNSSYNYHTERIVTTNYSSQTLTVNNYEFVYTNAEFSSNTIQPDLLVTDYVSQSHFDGFGIAILIALLAVIFFRLIKG